MKSKYVQYYVEGENEEKFINILKTDLCVIRPGKVQKLNVVEREFTDARLMALPPRTMVVLVFDTDTSNTDILDKNLKKLQTCSSISEIVTIPQVPNLEAELVCSCNINNITELLNSESKKKFKSDFIRVTNLANKLREHHFDIKKLWCGTPTSPFQKIRNQSEKVKLLK